MRRDFQAFTSDSESASLDPAFHLAFLAPIFSSFSDFFRSRCSQSSRPAAMVWISDAAAAGVRVESGSLDKQ